MFESCAAMPPPPLDSHFMLDFSTRYVFTIFIKTRQTMLLVKINERGMQIYTMREYINTDIYFSLKTTLVYLQQNNNVVVFKLNVMN